MIQALVFDLDGTLVNSEMIHFQAWRQTLLDHGVVEFSAERFLDYVGTSNEQVAADHRAATGLSVAELVREKQQVYLGLIRQIPLCDGVREILAAYRGRLTLAVATSSHQREAMALLHSHGLADFFTLVLGGDMVERKKPNPEIYLKVLSCLGLAPHDCVAFEDSGHGLLAAKDAGMYGVVVANEYTRHHDFARADASLGGLGEVDDSFLQRLAARRPRQAS